MEALDLRREKHEHDPARNYIALKIKLKYKSVVQGRTSGTATPC